jgi:hypothetical protein
MGNVSNGIDDAVMGEDGRRKARLGVVGREIGGVGGTSPVASVSVCNACCSIRNAATAETRVMSHCALLKRSGWSERSVSVGSWPVVRSVLGFGGGGGLSIVASFAGS